MARPIMSLPELIEIQPCTEEGLVTLEARLGGAAEREFFDPHLLCRYIGASPAFERTRCSPEMGYGVVERGGRNTHAFKTGKVIVRRAEGKEKALESLHLVSRSLWPAMRLEGGGALVDWPSSGAVAALPGPPAEGGELPLTAGVVEAVAGARRLSSWSAIERGSAVLRAVLEEFPDAPAGRKWSGELKGAESQFLAYTCSVDEAPAAAVGLLFLSASLAAERLLASAEGLGPRERRELCRAARAALEALTSGKKGEPGALSGPRARAWTDLLGARLPAF